jgi:ABC-type tungstate transport system substrate-binding protein
MCVATNNIDTRHTMLQGSQSVDRTLETQSCVTVTRAPSRATLTIITQYSPTIACVVTSQIKQGANGITLSILLGGEIRSVTMLVTVARHMSSRGSCMQIMIGLPRYPCSNDMAPFQGAL